MHEKISTQLIVFAMLVTALVTDSPAVADFLPSTASANIAAASAPATASPTFERGPDMSQALTIQQANAAWDSYIARNFPTISN